MAQVVQSFTISVCILRFSSWRYYHSTGVTIPVLARFRLFSSFSATSSHLQSINLVGASAVDRFQQAGNNQIRQVHQSAISVREVALLKPTLAKIKDLTQNAGWEFMYNGFSVLNGPEHGRWTIPRKPICLSHWDLTNHEAYRHAWAIVWKSSARKGALILFRKICIAKLGVIEFWSILIILKVLFFI